MRTDPTRRDELARFLRDRRTRLNPADFGIAAGGRRRTAGLRREEIADAADISTTWYVWLEQGRDVKASPHALRALGKALRLSTPEQTYLFQLARPDLDWRPRLTKQEMPSANLLAVLEGLAPHPAYIVNRYAQVVASNDPARRLLGPFDPADDWGGSLIARLFLDPLWRERFIDWSIVARSAVAQFRLATVAMADDPVLVAMIVQLQSASPEFAACWNDRELAEPPIWQKSVRHPLAGKMRFDFATLRPGGRDGDFTLSVYTPADRASRAGLAKLLSTPLPAKTSTKRTSA